MTQFPETPSVDPSSCIFCRIVAGDAPCHRVYEDADVLAFMGAAPKPTVFPPGHRKDSVVASSGAYQVEGAPAGRWDVHVTWFTVDGVAVHSHTKRITSVMLSRGERRALNLELGDLPLGDQKKE